MSANSKLNADPGVAQAVDAMLKNKKFKRMLLFSMRNLAELCAPPTNKYKENSLQAVRLGVVPILTDCVKNFDDDDAIVLCSKVLWGMSDAFVLQQNVDDLVDEFMRDGGVDSMLAILNRGSGEGQILAQCLDFIQNISEIHIELDHATLVGGLLRWLNPKLDVSLTLRIITIIANVATQDGGAAEIARHRGCEEFLSYCLLSSSTNHFDFSQLMKLTFAMTQQTAMQNLDTEEMLEDTIALMDMHKGNRAVAEWGGAALAKMVGPDKLKECLAILATSDADAESRNSALTMLSSMSYISAYTDAIVAANGIPLLIDAVNRSSSELAAGRADSKLLKGLAGACKMLGSIAANPQHTETISKEGGILALVTVLGYIKDHPDALASCFEALIPIARGQKYVAEVDAIEGVAQVLALLYTHIADVDCAKAGMQLVSTFAGHANLLPRLFELNIVDLLSTALQYHVHELQYQITTITCLSRFMPQVDSIARPAEFGAIPALAESNCVNLSDHSFATAMAKLTLQLAHLPDAQEPLQEANIAGGVLLLWLEHRNDENVKANCLAVLDAIATEQDVKTTLATLQRSLKNARNDAASAKQSLAAVGGLGQIARLHSMFEQHDVNGVIMEGIQRWVDGAVFDERQPLIFAATAAVQSLLSRVQRPLDKEILSLIDIALSQGIKSLLEKQEPHNNNLLDILRTVESLILMGDLGDAEPPLDNVIAGIAKVLKKFPDIRRVQIVCFNILSALCPLQKARGTAKIVEEGLVKHAIATIQRIVIHEDLQAAGYNFLLHCLKQDPELPDLMRRIGALDAIKSTQRMHRRSPVVKKYLSPVVQLLLPVEMIEEQIAAILQEVELLTKDGKADGLPTLLHDLANLCDIPVGSKIAARLKVGVPINALADFLPSGATNASSKPMVQTLAEAAGVCVTLTQGRVGTAHIHRTGGIHALISYFDSLSAAPNSSAKTEGLSACVVAIERLMRYDKSNQIIAYEKGMFAKFIKFAEQYPDNERILSEVISAVAAMNVTGKESSAELRTLLEKLVTILRTSQDSAVRLRCVETLEQILRDSDKELIDFAADAGAIGALMNCVDQAKEEPNVAFSAMSALNHISKSANLRAHLQKNGAIVKAVDSLHNGLVCSLRDSESCKLSLRLLADIATKEERQVLEDIGLLGYLSDATRLHPTNKDIQLSCAKLLKLYDAEEAIRGFIDSIIAVDQNSNGWPIVVQGLTEQLNVFLSADIPSSSPAFSKLPELYKVLGAACKKDPNNVDLHHITAIVCRRLLAKFDNEPNHPSGAMGQLEHIVPQYISRLTQPQSGKNVANSREFLIECYSTLTALAANPHSRPALMKMIKDNGLIQQTEILLAKSRGDAPVVASILNFLGQIAADKEGCDELSSHIGKGPNALAGDFSGTVSNLMNLNRKSGAVLQAGFAALGMFVTNCGKIPDNLLNEQFLKSLEGIADESPEGLGAYIDFLGKLLAVKDAPADLLARQILNATAALERTAGDELTSADKAKLVAGLANLAEGMVKAGLTDQLKSSDILDRLTELFRDVDDIESIAATCRALTEVAAQDADLAAKLARNFAPSLLTRAGRHALLSDPAAADAALDLILALASHEGNGQLISSIMGWKDTLEGIKAAAEKWGPEGSELSTKVDKVIKAVEDDAPESITLSQIYEKWTKLKEGGEQLNLPQSMTLSKHFDIVISYTEEYGTKQVHKDAEVELGVELTCGLRCIDLVHENPANMEICMEKAENEVVLGALGYQKDQHLLDAAVITALSGCQYPVVCAGYAQERSARPTITKALHTCMTCTTLETEEQEDMLIRRCKLIQMTATVRTAYNDTNVMELLIALWDRCDDGQYSELLLSSIFRAMRAIVNEKWAAVVLKANVPERLIDLIADVETEITLLPDVLFLIGSLASVSEIKSLLGELGAVEAILERVTRLLTDPERPGSTPAVTNACLSLANVVVTHRENNQRFVDAKGLPLSVKVIETYSGGGTIQWDIQNGASVLLCNASFKRDDVKQQYGKCHAPEALMKVISKYDGEATLTAHRGVGSMFKAIANLSLYTPNVAQFLDNGIEKVFCEFLKNSGTAPDSLLESSLHTLSNLVMENLEQYMVQFGILIEPMLAVLKKGHSRSNASLTLAFEIMASLGRLAENAATFVAAGGIETVLGLVNNVNEPHVFEEAIKLIAVQTRVPTSLPILLKNGVYRFIISVFDTQADLSQDESSGSLCVGTIRCVRRMIQSRELADEFIAANGVTSLLRLMASKTDSAVVQLEGYKVIFALLTMYPGADYATPSTTDDDEFGGDVGDEGVLPLVERVDRPPSPRGWERLQLDSALISTLIISIGDTLSKEGNCRYLRLVRCGLGLLAYFACEKVPNTIDAFYTGATASAIAAALVQFNDSDLYKTCAYILNNVCYVSELSAYSQLRQEPDLIYNLEGAVATISKKDTMTLEILGTLVARLNDTTVKPPDFQDACAWIYPLMMSKWDEDPYPNGVQDLPTSVRDAIRAGSVLSAYNPRTSAWETFTWKSTHDMIGMTYKFESSGLAQIAVGRIRAVTCGPTLPNLTGQGSYAKTVVSLLGPSTADAPNGLELNINAKSRKPRDKLYEMMTQWRDAASSS